MADFTVYYDASGQQNTGKPLTVVGLLSSDEKWRKFDQSWAALLKRHEIPYLHMREFTSSIGPFKTWKKDEDRRKLLLSEAIGTIKRGIQKVYAAYASPAHFDQVRKKFVLGPQFEQMYPVLATSAAILATGWIRLKGPHHIHHLLEEGDEGQATAVRFIRADCSPFPVRAIPKKDATGTWIPGLQAADFIAYEFNTANTRIDKGQVPPPKLRGSFSEILRQLPIHNIWWSAEILTKHCENHPTRYPPRT